ncbi:MAG: DHH family phosphoesterase [Bacilli bacterium]|nr:DHH family phosphoesterase [Bacilli bacterium]
MKYVTLNEDSKSNYGENVLLARGVKDIKNFIHPSQEMLQTPFDLKNMAEAVYFVKDKMDLAAPQILLIVDCDVDGFTSSAIIYQYLKKYNSYCDIEWLIHEGKQHGLEDKIDLIMDGDRYYDLLIIPDAGSNDYEYIERLKQKQLPVLVLDHHILESEVSDNCIIVNNQNSPDYKNKDLSGAGVAYQFCRAFDALAGRDYSSEFIDLAALGVCGDMMSALEPENQYIWRTGFSNVTNYFFQTLMRKQAYSITGASSPSDSEIMDKLTPISVAFYIVPMINAMIRIGTMEEKERLFLAFIDGHQLVPCNKRGAKGTMEEVAIESARECTNAKKHQDDKKKEVAEALEIKIHKHGLLDNKVLFIRLDDDDDFPSELNGLVCMQLSQKYSRPTILGRLNDEGFIRGSARGLNKSELKSFKTFLNDTNLFEYTAGHDNAFGISIKNEYLDDLHSYANKELADINLGENVYQVSFVRRAVESDIKDIVFDLAKYDKVWGQQNDTPLILIQDLFIKKNDIKVIGRNSDTLRFEKNGITYIKFFAKELIAQLQEYDEMKITLIGKTNVNEWNSKITPQIFIEDLEVENAKLAF